MIHQLVFSPVGPVEPGQDVHLLSGKQADVADFLCPECGMKMFVYYRLLPAGGWQIEDEEEGDEE